MATLVAGINDLATTHAYLASEWVTSEVLGKSPQTLSAGSKFSALWIRAEVSSCHRGVSL